MEQEVLSPEEMVEIEKELRQRKELLESKCRQLEQYLPEPKDEVSYLRSSSEMLIWVSFDILCGMVWYVEWGQGSEIFLIRMYPEHNLAWCENYKVSFRKEVV